jgi:hypothetical protein
MKEIKQSYMQRDHICTIKVIYMKMKGLEQTS